MQKPSIPAPNFTQTPNVLFDDWLPNLTHVQLKVLMVIMRKTFGWHKIRDRISLSQLATLTGSNKTNVSKAADELQKMGLIKKEVSGEKGAETTFYELVIEEDSNNFDRYQSSTPPGTTVVPTKETITKEKKRHPADVKSAELIARATHVSTSSKEHEELIELIGKEMTEKCYELLSIHKQQTPPTKWKNGDYLSIRKWVIKAVKQNEIEEMEIAKKAYKSPQNRLKQVHDYIRSHDKKDVLREAEKRNLIRIEKDHIAVLGGATSNVLSFTDKGIEEQINSLIRKLEARIQ